MRAAYDEQNNTITLEISNRSSYAASLTIAHAYRARAIDLVLAPGEAEARRWSLARTSGWYDLTVTVNGDPGFRHRLGTSKTAKTVSAIRRWEAWSEVDQTHNCNAF